MVSRVEPTAQEPLTLAVEGAGGEASAGRAAQGDEIQTSPAGSAEAWAGCPGSRLPASS